MLWQERSEKKLGAAESRWTRSNCRTTVRRRDKSPTCYLVGVRGLRRPERGPGAAAVTAERGRAGVDRLVGGEEGLDLLGLVGGGLQVSVSAEVNSGAELYLCGGRILVPGGR